MLDQLKIRASKRSDWAAVEALYPEAFPDEDLLPLVRQLWDHEFVTLSLVATVDAHLAGHVFFTKCGVAGESIHPALLGPLGVSPAWQRQGIGTAIVRAGLQRLTAAGADVVYVLGDPAYYGRLGFCEESLVEPPFPLPAEWEGAWQSRALRENTHLRAGVLSVPEPWRRPALWAP